MEAKNAAIILPDADLDLTVRECILGCLSFNGQRCTAIKIVFVHAKIVDNFLDSFSRAITNLRFGMPWEDDVFITPLPEPDKPAYLSDLVQDALQMGAKIINPSGGTANNTFFYPALLYPVNERMRIYNEEQFGPVIPVLSFDDIETPVQYIVSSDYGQQISIFGNDPEMIADLIDPMVNQVCRVNINSQCQRGPDTFPFTGRKEFHKGIDISTRIKSPIYAPADGIVSFMGRDRGYGKMVWLRHGNGILTKYGHLNTALVKKGQHVKRGETIALVGNTGRSTGPHLHYEVHLNGVAVNPIRYILN